MPKSKRDELAQCPFYIFDDAEKIVCEGVNAFCKTQLVFRKRSGHSDSARQKEYFCTYCGRNYKECLVYEMLESKYE